MVEKALKYNVLNDDIRKKDIIDISDNEVKWSTVSISEVVDKSMRLEAGYFDVNGKHAREVLNNCKWALSSISGDKGLANAYHRPRFKRIWLEHSEYPIYQPSQILEINPMPSGYISKKTETDIESLRVKKGQILLTCSGTIGRTTIVNNTLNNKVFSHDLIRITPKEEIDIGYVYTFLKTEIGNTLVATNNYGAVVSHIEPKHLNNIPIPNPTNILKKRISDKVMESFKLRDESNELIKKAQQLFIEELHLPPINEIKSNYFEESAGFKNYLVKLSDLNYRLDGSYHIPITYSIIEYFNKYAKDIVKIGDSNLSRDIILPGRFKRIYVEEGQGTLFFGVKQIMSLDPSDSGKYLSMKKHNDIIDKELGLTEGTILISRSGTIGNIAFVPKHWEGWAASEDLIRIIPKNNNIGGYIYVYLTTDYGQSIAQRFVYGSVQDHLDYRHVEELEIPLLKDKDIQDEINSLALKANEKRYEAYKLEQMAIKIMNEEVIHKQ